MITLQRSLNSLVVLAGLLSLSAFASTNCSQDFEVLERRVGLLVNQKYQFVSKTLTDLDCSKTKFEGKYFKIVHGTKSEAIPFNSEDTQLVRKAANVYYHLTLAREFWAKEIKSEYVQNMPQITIRLEISNGYSSVRHFKHEDQEINQNNAWTIPKGQTPPSVKQRESWGQEIWFSPKKVIKTKKLMPKDSKGENPVHQSLLLVNEPITQYMTNALIYQGLSLLAYPEQFNSNFLMMALERVGTIAVVFGLTTATKYMDPLFVNKYFFIDTAMIPEIIYHEFSHVAMSDTMVPKHSVPVIEVMADYFATRIADRKKMYDSMKDYASTKAKDRESKTKYHPYLEGEWNATSDFTLSLLWKGRMEFEKLNKEREKKAQVPMVDYDQLVFQAHFELNESANIATDLVKALEYACKEKNVCDSPMKGTLMLKNVFEMKGLN